MKKILSILILAIASLLTAQATQTVTITTKSTTSTFGFRINKVNGSTTYKASNTRYAYTLTSGSRSGVSTITESTNYWTVVVTMNGNANFSGGYLLTLTITNDDLTFLEITSGHDQVAEVDVSGAAATLTSLNLKGCTNLTTLTLGTMSVLTDVNVANTSVAVANTITADNCPALQNFNVAGCGISSLTYAGTTLYSLDVSSNSLTSLNVSGNANLDILRCEGNSSLATLTLPSSISTLSAKNCALTNVTGYGETLQVFDVADNALSSLSVSEMVSTTDLDISNNHLTFRSFPSEKPARTIYEGNDGVYPITDNMRPAFGSYTYPLQTKLSNYEAHTDAESTLDLSDDVLDGNDNKNVNITFEDANGTELSKSVSDVDGNDYTIDSDNDLYGFMNTQEQVRARFTDDTYPLLTLYSGYFTVPDGVSGTLKIVDEDGSVLYTKGNVFFSDALQGLPDYAKRDYTKYTIPAIPTIDGDTWTVIAAPSDDAPFGWAKTYGSATWYYMSLGVNTDKWVTAGERNGEGGTLYGGHALKSSYDTSDENYYWAFVGNQYDGFVMYNKGCGSSQGLRDYSGFPTPPTGGYFPIMGTGTPLRWIVRTNSSGTGFSLENKNGGTDNVNGGVTAPCFLNNYGGMGFMNYWITAVYDAQNNTGSLFNLTKAADPISGLVKWVIVDENDNPIYNVAVDATVGETVSAYPSELTTLASNRFVALADFPGSFTVAAGDNVKRIGYTWNGPFNISTTNKEYHYQLKIRNALFIVSNTRSDGALDCVSTDATTNEYRWMFFGDPFNGFNIRNYAKGTQELAALNGTSNGNFPTFSSSGTKWIVTKCTQNGQTNPFSISPAANTGEYWNQFGGVDNNQGVKYWSSNGTSDAGSAIQAILIDEVINSVNITWNVIDDEGNVKLTVDKEYNLNSTVSEYPSEMTAYEERFVGYPTLSAFTATTSRTLNVPYSWTGPFALTDDIDNPTVYRLKSARYGYYAYVPKTCTEGSSVTQNSRTKQSVSPRGLWFFTGNPFDGIEVHTYYNPTLGLSPQKLTSTPTKFHVLQGVTGRTADYYSSTYEIPVLFGLYIPGTDVTVRNSCVSEQIGLWNASAIDNDYGVNFVVETVDLEHIVNSGIYRIHSAAEGFTDIYMSVDEDNSAMCNNRKYAKSTDLQRTAFRVEEQDNFTFLIMKHGYNDNETCYYLKGANSATTDVSEAASNSIDFNTNYNAFTINMGGSYANIDTWTNNLAGYNIEARSTWKFEPVEIPANSLDGQTYYTTAYMPFDYTLPANVKAYALTVNGNEANTNELSCVPAGTGVLLVGDGVSNIKMEYKDYELTSADNTNIANNKMNGSYVNLTTSDPDYPTNKFYVFSGDPSTGEVGFYKWNGAITAYKAWLEVDASSVLTFKLVFGEDGTLTGIETVPAAQDANEFSWGNPESWKNATIYDVQGRRITQPQKGNIYIVNGRKMFYK